MKTNIIQKNFKIIKTIDNRDYFGKWIKETRYHIAYEHTLDDTLWLRELKNHYFPLKLCKVQMTKLHVGETMYNYFLDIGSVCRALRDIDNYIDNNRIELIETTDLTISDYEDITHISTLVEDFPEYAL